MKIEIGNGEHTLILRGLKMLYKDAMTEKVSATNAYDKGYWERRSIAIDDLYQKVLRHTECEGGKE